MKSYLVLFQALCIVFAGILNCQHYALSQDLNNEEIREKQFDNTVKLRELMKELLNTVTTLRLERQAYYEKKQEREQTIQDLRIQIKSLKEAHEDLKGELEEREGEMDILDGEARRLESAILMYQDKEDKLTKWLLSYVNILRGLTNDGIPFHIAERRIKLDAITNGKTIGKLTNIADTCNQLWGFCKDELRLATTSEIYRDTIQLEDGREPHAEFLRVGKVILAFKTEDDEDWGIWLKKEDKSNGVTSAGWVLNRSGTFLHSVQEAIKMLKRQHPAEFINFPVNFSNVNIQDDNDK